MIQIYEDISEDILLTPLLIQSWLKETTNKTGKCQFIFFFNVLSRYNEFSIYDEN